MNRSEWTQVFSSLPDSAFFEVVRHYLGPVSTPFHKPDLVTRMDAFFNRSDVRQRVFEYLDEDDLRLLSITAYMDGISGGRIAGMVPDMSYTVLRGKLLNLEERLLVWSRPSGRVRHYALTPLGEQIRIAGKLGPGTIIGRGKEGPVPNTASWLDDNFLTSALAFLSREPLLFRKEGGWRKKSLEQLAAHFPVLFADGHGEARLIMAGRGLLSMGLVRRRGEKLIPDLEAWRNLEDMPFEDRDALVRARAAVGRSISPENAVMAVRLLAEGLPPGRYYAPRDLASLFQLASGSGVLSPAGARRVISHLELLGVLVADGEGNLATARGAGGNRSSTALLTVTPVGDVSLSPESTLFCDLALAAGSGRLDVMAGFSFEKATYQDGIENGIDTRRFLNELERRSGHPVPGNLRTLFEEWESEYRELGARIGVVLRADGLRREILESSGILEDLALENPAPGLWILDPADEDTWRSALRSIGIEQIPGLPERIPAPRDTGPTRESVESAGSLLSWSPSFRNSPLNDGSWEAPEVSDCSDFLAGLEKAAADSDLTPEEQTVFAERLERKLILAAGQIRKGAWRYEVMSARGLDYRAKIRLAEAALAGRDERLEVSVAAGNEIETVLVLPQRLEKDGDDHVLVGISLPGEDEVQFKIRKIGFLKRIRASLF